MWFARMQLITFCLSNFFLWCCWNHCFVEISLFIVGQCKKCMLHIMQLPSQTSHNFFYKEKSKITNNVLILYQLIKLEKVALHVNKNVKVVEGKDTNDGAFHTMYKLPILLKRSIHVAFWISIIHRSTCSHVRLLCRSSCWFFSWSLFV